jgi:hypothetical protein
MSVIDRQHYALQTIFSFFLGLMVAAFIGVGVNTFYPSPGDKYAKPRQEMSRRQEALSRKAAPGNMTAAEQAQIDSLNAEQDAANEKQQAEIKDWARVTSIILVIFATLVLVVSLILSVQLRVISNGLLLGGLFTMIYGTGWAIFSGNSVTRFWVILFALIVSIGLGYAKFVRGRRPEGTPRPGSGSAPDDAALGAISARVNALEKRAAAAAAALGGGGPDEA